MIDRLKQDTYHKPNEKDFQPRVEMKKENNIEKIENRNEETTRENNPEKQYQVTFPAPRARP